MGCHETELSTMTESDAQATKFQPPGEVDQHRLAVVRCGIEGVTGRHIGQDLGERDRTEVHPVLVDILRFEARDNHHGTARAGHRDREQSLTTRAPESPEVRQYAAMRGAAIADGEDHSIAALSHGLLDSRDREWLRSIAEDEVAELRAS